MDVDRSYIDDHYYTAKAPGLTTLVTLPWYAALDLTGLVVSGPPAETLWPEARLDMPETSVRQVGLVGATLPALLLLLLLLVRYTVELLVPGYGTVAAVGVGAGSLGHDVIDANASGFFGVGAPRLRAGVELLFAGIGALVITPMWALAIAGLPMLWREGHRGELALVGFVVCALLLYNASYYLPLGGGTPGPRFLVPALPFLALPLAAAWRAMPLAALSLALVSIVVASASRRGRGGTAKARTRAAATRTRTKSISRSSLHSRSAPCSGRTSRPTPTLP